VKRNCANNNGEHDTRGLLLQRSEENRSLLRSQPVLHLISSLESSNSSTRMGSKRQTRHLLLPVTPKLLTPTTTLYNSDLPPATRNKCRYTHLALLKKSWETWRRVRALSPILSVFKAVTASPGGFPPSSTFNQLQGSPFPRRSHQFQWFLLICPIS